MASYPVFWIDVFHPHGVKQHTAFRARSREEVQPFHEAAIAAGGRDNGAPGLRSGGYTSGYYAVFVLTRTATTSKPSSERADEDQVRLGLNFPRLSPRRNPTFASWEAASPEADAANFRCGWRADIHCLRWDVLAVGKLVASRKAAGEICLDELARGETDNHASEQR